MAESALEAILEHALARFPLEPRVRVGLEFQAKQTVPVAQPDRAPVS